MININTDTSDYIFQASSSSPSVSQTPSPKSESTSLPHPPLTLLAPSLPPAQLSQLAQLTTMSQSSSPTLSLYDATRQASSSSSSSSSSASSHSTSPNMNSMLSSASNSYNPASKSATHKSAEHKSFLVKAETTTTTTTTTVTNPNHLHINYNRNTFSPNSILRRNLNELNNQINEVILNKVKISSTQATDHEQSMRPSFNDKWILIQKNTFTNWVNEQFKSRKTGAAESGEEAAVEADVETGESDAGVVDLKEDLVDGVKLIKLVNSLQHPNSRIRNRYFKKPMNQHQCLENITLALNAITDDGVKLVNIGNADIANGNLKLILGLIWHLILHYQIGKTKVPPKKLILAWLRAILPQISVTNLTKDLNDGIALGGIINYCDPELLIDWMMWDPNQKLENCSKAMNCAYSEFKIPLVVTPANMASPELDELSAITYLSYFMKRGSPGYRATLKWIQKQMPDEKITNFSTDWNDGWLLLKLVRQMGVQVAGYPNIDRNRKEFNCQLGLEACQKLNVETYVTAKELAEADGENIGLMAMLAQFKYIKPVSYSPDLREISPLTLRPKAKAYLNELKNDPDKVFTVGRPIEFSIEYVDTEVKNIRTNVRGPKSYPSVVTDKISTGLLKCHFVPLEVGRHELVVQCDDQILEECPIGVEVQADSKKVCLLSTKKQALVNQPFEICINPVGAKRGADVLVKARLVETPAVRAHTYYNDVGQPDAYDNYENKATNEREEDGFIIYPVEERDAKYYAKILPTRIGEWAVYVFYNKEELKDSPYRFDVYDPNQVEIIGLNKVIDIDHVERRVSFQVSTAKAGKGVLEVELINTRLNRTVPVQQTPSAVKDGLYDISFCLKEPGQYICLLMFNNKQIKGSPIDFNVAVDMSQIAVDFQNCKSLLVNQTSHFTVECKDPSNVQGDVKVVVTSPHGANLPAKAVQDQNGGRWKVDFKPSEIGEYYIDIFYANQLVAGSPFKANVFDPAKIRIVPTFFGVVDQAVKFEVDASQAGFGQLEIAVENGRIPCTFLNQGNLKFVPSFTPKEAGKYEVTVKFNSYEVPDSPFICNIIDVSKVSLLNYDSRNPILLPVYKTNSLELNANDLSSSNINIKLLSPSGSQLPINRSITPQNTLKLQFQPSEIGTHRLEIDYAGVAIPGSPFEIKVYDTQRISVSEIKGGEVNKQCELIIDASSAGEGQLEIGINDGQIKNNVKQIKPGQYSVTFMPVKADKYVVDVKFNREIVPGCPKQIVVKELQSAKISSSVSESVLVGAPVSFELDSIPNVSDLDVRIKAPSAQEFVPKVLKIGVDECRIEWTPFELGSYTVNITYCGQVVKGAPLRIKTYDPKRVQIYNMIDGHIFKPCVFCIDASQAGEGSLEIGISCNGHYIPNQVKPLGNSKFEVHFLPQEATVHYANINFNSEPVRGSPFPIKIGSDLNLSLAPSSKGLGFIPINVPANFQIITNHANSNAGQIRVTAIGPQGENVPVKLIQQPNGDCFGEFLPLTVGQYRIDIFHLNNTVVGSPQIATAFDPMALEISHLPQEFMVGVESFIEVNLSKLGNIEFDVKITSPTGMSLPLTYESQGLRKVIRLIPNEPGLHRVMMQLAGHPISGTPLAINCAENRTPVARGEGLYHGIEDKPAFFFVDAQGMHGNLEVKIEGPQHFTKNLIERQADGTYVVKYTPVEVGMFKIFVQWNNRDIVGSPFRSYVVNPEKVRVVNGWQSILDYSNTLNLKLYEERMIKFDTTDAGPGTLEATILAPNGTKLPLRLTNQSQIYTLTFTALFEGEYKIYVLWDNHPIPNSPITARTQHQSDVNRIEVNGVGLHEAKINQEADFVIDGTRAGDLFGLPEIKLTGTRCDIEVRMMQLGHNIYRCSYVPQIPGAYLLNIKWNDRQIGDSPYKVNIGMNSDPSKVIVSGEGIKTGILGQDIKAIIDTRRAGPGELTAHCMGTQKVAFCEFYDHKDGTFTLYVKPQEAGRHVLQIKYNDEHVPGSPFGIRITGPPDASKVRVIGPGIAHGVLNKFKSRFICETKGAGAGQLTVRIRGPKGAFRVEMQRENQKDRTILCKYDPLEAGDYQINVKWSGQHVPGSPFNVHIFNHDDEFEHFLRMNPEAAYFLQQQQQLSINC